MKAIALFTIILALLLGQSCTRRRVVLETGLPGAAAHGRTTHEPNVPAVGIALLSGALYGIHESVVHTPNRIPAGWNRQWWDASVSWRNQYAGADPRNGPRFPGSTTTLAWSTDAKSLFGAAHRGTLFLSGVTITLGEKKPVWHYLVDASLSAVAFGLGYHTLYSSPLLFRG